MPTARFRFIEKLKRVSDRENNANIYYEIEEI